VRDNGPGIPEDDLPHIFARFYRVDKSRDKTSGGAGLGLAIAHKILDLHRQKLDARSTVGEGTAFHFHLPAPLPPGRKEPSLSLAVRFGGGSNIGEEMALYLPMYAKQSVQGRTRAPYAGAVPIEAASLPGTG